MHHAPSQPTRPVLVEDALYELDHGRISCGRLECAGRSAHFAGLTSAGERVRRLTRRELQQQARDGIDAQCECCGMTPDGLRPPGHCAFCQQPLERGLVCGACQEELG